LKKIIIFSIAGLLVLGGGGAAAYFLLFKDSSPATSEIAAGDGEAAAIIAEIDLPPAMYHNLPPLVVNADYQGRLRYLQVKMSIMTRDEGTLEKLQANNPLLQDSLITLLDSYEITHLETPEGKEELRQAAQARVKELIRGGGIESVLFTGFVIQ
jgi:flagellar FliL protein